LGSFLGFKFNILLTGASRRHDAIHLGKLLNRAVALLVGALYWKGRRHLRLRSGPLLGTLAGFALGLRLRQRYWRLRMIRERLQRVLLMELEEEQLEYLMHQVPYWISIQEYERVIWLNKIVRLVWPCYNSALRRVIAEALERVLNAHKPAFISSIQMKKVTLGDIPFDVQKVRLVSNSKEDLVLEAAVRWNARDAQVALLIAPMKGVTLVPKLRQIHIYATVRLVLKPLVGRLPCFGAVAVALKQPPLVNFELDFGMIDFGKVVPLGSRYLAMARHVEAWLKPFLVSDVLGNLLVWPNRLVIPLMPEEITGPLDDLRLTTRGILRVTVVEARGLKSEQALWWGMPDPVAVLHISPLDKKSTRGQGNTLDPVWNQQLFFKVQEESLPLVVEVRDGDGEMDLLVDKPAASSRADDLHYDLLLGRAVVPLSGLEPNREVDLCIPLGKGEVADDGGPGMGAGEIRLKLCYWHLSELKRQFSHHPMHVCSSSASLPHERSRGTRPDRSLRGSLPQRRPGGPRSTLAAQSQNRQQRLPSCAPSLGNQRAKSDAGPSRDVAGGSSAPGTEIAPCRAVLLDPCEEARRATGRGAIPLQDLPPQRGILFLLLVRAEHVPQLDVVGSCDPVIRLHVGRVKRESTCKTKTQFPVWNERFDFFNIEVTGRILVKLYDATYMGKWKVGSTSIPLAEVASSRNGILHKTVRVHGQWASPDTTITLALEWIPLDGNPVPCLGPPDDESACSSSLPVGRSEDTESCCSSALQRNELWSRQNHEKALAAAIAGVREDAGEQDAAETPSGDGGDGFCFSDWVETPSQLAPVKRACSKRAQPKQEARLSVRVMGLGAPLPKPSSVFCELRLSRSKPQCTGLQRTSGCPFWDEQFCWQDVRESDVLTLRLMQQKGMWKDQVGVLRIHLREIRGAPGSILVGSWRFSETRGASTEISMELIWWDAGPSGHS